MTYVGGSLQAGATRVDSNHFPPGRALRPAAGVVQPPAVNSAVTRLLPIFDQSPLLQQPCR